MAQGYSLSDTEVQQLVTRMDVNKDGKIVFDEFATCLLDWPEFRSGNKWQKLVRRAFDKLDLNGDGHISLEELMALLPEFYDTEDARKEAVRLCSTCDVANGVNVWWLTVCRRRGADGDTAPCRRLP